MVGHNLVIASIIQTYTLLFSTSESEIRSSRKRLERNFELLLQLRSFWPVLEISFEAFRTFREACRRDMEKAFRMDEWMLRVFYGFANNVEDKEVMSWRWRAIGRYMGQTLGNLVVRDGNMIY
jgi:hypothetical protein